MQDATTDQHSRLRSDMNAGFDKIRDEFNRGIGGVSTRVGTIEHEVIKINTERSMKEQAATRNIAVYSIISGVVVTLLIEAFKFFLHRP